MDTAPFGAAIHIIIALTITIHSSMIHSIMVMEVFMAVYTEAFTIVSTILIPITAIIIRIITVIIFTTIIILPTEEEKGPVTCQPGGQEVICLRKVQHREGIHPFQVARVHQVQIIKHQERLLHPDPEEPLYQPELLSNREQPPKEDLSRIHQYPEAKIFQAARQGGFQMIQDLSTTQSTGAIHQAIAIQG